MLRSLARQVLSTQSRWIRGQKAACNAHAARADALEKQTGPIIGIDLGTCNSCAAIIKNKKPLVFENRDGSKITPSVVTFLERGRKRLVGVSAKRQLLSSDGDFNKTFVATKRIIGRKYDEPEVQALLKKFPFKIVPSPTGEAWIETRDRYQYSPVQIAAFILTRIRRNAERELRAMVKKAVIAVPPHFTDSQRTATMEAGRLAGLSFVQLIHEPSAAAMAYGFDADKKQTIAVFDLGGGTLDVSIISVENCYFNVHATDGDCTLGGEDFDYALADHLLKALAKHTDAHITKNARVLHLLKETAEKAKIELSNADQTTISMPNLLTASSGKTKFKEVNITVTKEAFEQMVDKLTDRIKDPCARALQQAGVKADAIDEVVLAGGMTNMPKIRQTVQEIFNHHVDEWVNPDEAIAIGAAIQGAMIAGDLTNCLLWDRTPLSLGIETATGSCEFLVPKNSRIPTTRRQIFTTNQDNQTKLEFTIMQGEHQDASKNKKLGQFILSDLPAAPRGSVDIVVTFHIDEGGLLHVSAVDKKSGLKQKISVDGRQADLPQNETGLQNKQSWFSKHK